MRRRDRGPAPALTDGTRDSASPRPARWLRRLRRFGLGLLGFVLLLTFASVMFNAFSGRPATLAAPNGEDVRVGVERVHYQRWGDHGSPIVLVHGAAESTVAWSLSAPLLSRHHVVYAVDLAGYGYSGYDGRYSLADEAGLVDGFVRALHLVRPVLVGHSLGAAVVGRVALDHPRDIAGVIFADGDALPFPGQAGRSPIPGWVLRTPYVTTLYRLATSWRWPGSAIIRAQCGTRCRGYSAGLADAWMRPLRQGAAEQALLDIAAHPLLALTPQQVRRVSVPRAIIWGAQDSSSGGSLAGARHNLHHPPTVVLPGAAHLSMVADPAGFAAAVDDLAGRMTTRR